MIAIRGAIRVERNERSVIFHDTQRMLREIQRRNGLEEADVVSVFFTMTPDLDADFPAYAAREMGWTDTAMLGAQETAVPGALDRVVRVLIHAEGSGPARHVYLGEAAAMRPDLAEEGDADRRPPVRERPEPSFGTLLVAGLGLIGGSAALALRRRGLFREVLGVDPDPEAREQARRAGAVDGTAEAPDELLDRTDVLLLALPVDAMLARLERWGPSLGRGTVVLDVGSTKAEVARAMERLPEGVEAVAGHPMAGSEESGMGAARPDLFHGARWALVATDRTGERAEEVAEAVVEGVGGSPFWTEAGPHDRATAATSHLPYLLAGALVRHLGERDGEVPVRDLMGPGAGDMTRLAGSEPSVMAGILSTNWPAVREEVEGFLRRLDALITELEACWSSTDRDDRARAAEMREILEPVREARDGLVGEEAPDAPPGR